MQTELASYFTVVFTSFLTWKKTKTKTTTSKTETFEFSIRTTFHSSIIQKAFIKVQGVSQNTKFKVVFREKKFPSLEKFRNLIFEVSLVQSASTTKLPNMVSLLVQCSLCLRVRRKFRPFFLRVFKRVYDFPVIWFSSHWLMNEARLGEVNKNSYMFDGFSLFHESK